MNPLNFLHLKSYTLKTQHVGFYHRGAYNQNNNTI